LSHFLLDNLSKWRNFAQSGDSAFGGIVSRVAMLYIFIANPPILEGLEMEYFKLYTFFDHLVCLVVAICCICGNLLYLWQFAVFVAICYICGNLLYLWQFAVFYGNFGLIYSNMVYFPKKSGNPDRLPPLRLPSANKATKN
jgi:hypothetical protein